MVSYYVTFVTGYGEIFSEPNSYTTHKMSGGFISLHASLIKPMCFGLWFMRLEALLGLLNPRLEKKKGDCWIYCNSNTNKSQKVF